MKSQYKSGIPDNLFIRGDIHMTKEEVRTISIAKLRLNGRSHLVDIGSGTGSVSIEAALNMPAGKIYAIEEKEDAVALIKKNKEKFSVSNIEVIHGEATEKLKQVEFIDRAFIGGSGGKLEEILTYLRDNMKTGGRVVINTITMETAMKSLKFFKTNDFVGVEIIQVIISRGFDSGDLTMMKGLTPVFVISAARG